jgi:hypothetical protein
MLQPKSFFLRFSQKPVRVAAACATAIAAAGALYYAIAALSFSPSLQPVGWVTRPALSSNNLSSNAEKIYRPGYVAGDWYGTLEAQDIDSDGDLGGASPWANKDAGVLLDGVAPNDRKIVTVKSDGTKIPFRWADLSTVQQTSLGSTTTGPNILNYIRGDRTNESTAAAGLRPRKRVLGDIVHSTLLRWNHGNGIRRLYVGANDGMLHVFDAANGQELYAYVPSQVISALPQLTIKPYTHRYFVDGPISASDVRIGTDIKTLLVGGLGAGGRALYALDITTTTATAAISGETDAANKIKWEVSSATSGFANLGFTYAAPRFARLNSGTAAVVVGNGYMNDGNYRAALFVINADTGAKIAEIDTGEGSSTSPNGLSSPTLVDTNGDGKSDLAYAGDLNGNLWKFNLTANTSSKIFTNTAAITTAPVVQNHPNGGYMVVFGTGSTLRASDIASTATHYVHGVWDGAPATNTSVLNQTLTQVVSGDLRYRTASLNAPDWTASKDKGWRLQLPPGERVVGEAPFLNDGRFYFTSTNPTVTTTTTYGENWVNQVNFMTGGGFTKSIFDINQDGLIGDADKVNSSIVMGSYLGTGVASQPVLTDLSILSLVFFNSNPDQIATTTVSTTTTTTTGGPGVSGGHFDVDIYYPSGASASSYANAKHVHEYDDKYDVTGVNMLNASVPAFNMNNAIASTTQTFKVLVMNQYLSPAATLSLGGRPYTSVKTLDNLASETNATTLLAGLPVYSRSLLESSTGSFAFNLPKDAFTAKDWWGDGTPARAGLIPSQTGCVHGVSSTGVGTRNGLFGERYNGALTIQLIKSNTPDSAIELNYPAGGAKYGWRLKQATFMTHILAEWTYFWHHDNGKCYGDPGWVIDPPQDNSTGGKTQQKAPGSADPNINTIGGPDGSGGSGGGTCVGAGCSVCVGPGCTPCVGPSCTCKPPSCLPPPKEGNLPTGRINWREITRE